MSNYLEDVKAYLSTKGVDYKVRTHPLAYTAQETAGAQHVPGKQLAKSVIIKAGDQYIMCVLPAIQLIDFSKLKAFLGNDDIRLATEDEIIRLFPGCDVGAEPPFGEWYKIPVVQDKTLADNDEIVFNAGTHTDAIQMKYSDWCQINHPIEGQFSIHI